MQWYPLDELPFEENIIAGAVFFMKQDVGALGKVLTKFQEELGKLNIASAEQAMEILILVDEVLSNALIASFINSPEKRGEMLFGRWHATKSEFRLVVIDLGKGLFRKILVERLDAGTSHSEIHNYQQSNVVTLLRNGEVYRHTRTGRGLAMLRGLASDFSIELITREWEIQDEDQLPPGNEIIGSRFTVAYAFAGNQ